MKTYKYSVLNIVLNATPLLIQALKENNELTDLDLSDIDNILDKKDEIHFKDGFKFNNACYHLSQEAIKMIEKSPENYFIFQSERALTGFKIALKNRKKQLKNENKWIQPQKKSLFKRIFNI